jgi:hypothetical protein
VRHALWLCDFHLKLLWQVFEDEVVLGGYWEFGSADAHISLRSPCSENTFNNTTHVVMAVDNLFRGEAIEKLCFLLATDVERVRNF